MGPSAAMDAHTGHNWEIAGRLAGREPALQSTGVAPVFAAEGRRGRSFTGRHWQAAHVEIAAGILIPATVVLCRHLQLAVPASPS
jgi:hypothetical protein